MYGHLLSGGVEIHFEKISTTTYNILNSLTLLNIIIVAKARSLHPGLLTALSNCGM